MKTKFNNLERYAMSDTYIYQDFSYGEVLVRQPGACLVTKYVLYA